MRVWLAVCLTGFCFCARAELAVVEPPREWKTVEGAGFQAAVVSFDGTTIVFRAGNGQCSPLPLSRLSAEDRECLLAWQKKQPIKVVLPDHVGVDTAKLKIEVVSEDGRNEKFVDRTLHLEFELLLNYN